MISLVGRIISQIRLIRITCTPLPPKKEATKRKLSPDIFSAKLDWFAHDVLANAISNGLINDKDQELATFLSTNAERILSDYSLLLPWIEQRDNMYKDEFKELWYFECVKYLLLRNIDEVFDPAL